MKEVENANNIVDEEILNIREYESGSPAKKVVMVLKDNKLVSADLAEANALAGDYEKLYDAANKPEATPEEKADFAAAAVLMQNSLKNCLINQNKTNPDSFKKDPNVANLYAAYSENSHATVEALQKSGVDAIDSLIKIAHTNAENHKIPQNEEEERRIENDIAKLMYLAHLKYEYQHVTGSDMDKKTWQSEILTELISDKFEENIEKFKQNPVCSEVIKQHKNVMNDLKSGKIKQENFPDVNSVIFQGFRDRADSDYQSIYPLVYNGIRYKTDISRRDQKEIDKVQNAVDEIDMMKALYSDIHVISTGNFPTVIDRDPVFDTLYMKRSSRLKGEQFNYAKFIKDHIDFDEQYKKDIVARQNEYKESYDKEIRDQEKRIGNPVVQRYVAEYFSIPKNIEKTQKLLDVEQKELDQINNTYWQEYETRYNSNHKKPITEKELIKAKKKQGDKPVNEEAKTKKMMIDDYKKSIKDFEDRRAEVVRRLEKDCGVSQDNFPTLLEAYNSYMRMKKGYTQKVKEKQERAKEDVDKYYKDLRGQEKKTEKAVNDEGVLYENAKKNNNTEELERIKAARAKRDEERKKSDPAIYECVQVGDKNIYIARNSKDSVDNLVLGYENLKQLYPEEDKKPEKKRYSDDTARKSIEEFETIDAMHSVMPSVTKPDRSNNKIQTFDVKIAPEMSISEFDLDQIQVDPSILKPEAVASEEPLEYIFNKDAELYFIRAYEKVLEDAFTFRQGSPEYKAIQDGLKELKKSSKNADLDMSVNIPKCRKILAVMDQYIDRKTDEMDASAMTGEKKKSKYRRVDVINAKAFLVQGLDLLEQQYGLDKNNYVPEDLSYQIEYAAKLKKVNNPEVNKIIDSLKKGDRLESQKLMQDYLLKHVKDYKNPEGGYSFKLKEEDPGKRIPDDKNERMFAMILKSYEKLANSNLIYYQKNEIDKLPKLIESVEHVDFKDGIGKSVNDVFGINVSTTGIKPGYKLKKTDNALDFAKQFDESYSCRVSMLSNDMFRNYMTNKAFDPAVSVTPEVSKELVNDAFSSMYLHAVHKNVKGPFSFDEVDVNRRKMLTVIHNTPITKNVEKALKELYTIENAGDRSASEIHEITEMNNHMIKDPASFNTAVVSTAVSMTAEDTLKEVNEMLNGSKRYNKNDMKTKLELLDKTSKIAKEIGMTHVLDRLNKKMQLVNKGKDFNETLKQIQSDVSNRNVRKHVKPANNVTL